MSDSFDKQALDTLLESAANGDADAWRIVVGEFTPKLFAFIRAQCGDPELAEEIAQETFCTIARKLDSYTELGRFESWLNRIAMNKLRDEKRRQKRHAQPVDFPTLTALAGTTGPSDDEHTADRLRRLREAMEKLTEADRRILHLRFVAGLTFRQIAEIQGEPLGTVLARKHRARNKLEELMMEDEDQD